MLRLLEWLCAVVAVLYAVLLVLFTNYGALLITYKNGDLTPTIAGFAVACAGWLGLRLVRSPRGFPVGVFIVAACLVGLASVTWWTSRSDAEEQRVTPSPSTGRVWDSQPPDYVPGTAPPPPPPSAGP
ncbi:hypothetical protein [Streptomyces sp. NPDC046821]|uniref:hypothetical protein n=1 Tax=Streptomyces sp. NPDC046821 TaxID=3154702 RepID=UPI0033E3DD6F